MRWGCSGQQVPQALPVRRPQEPLALRQDPQGSVNQEPVRQALRARPGLVLVPQERREQKRGLLVPGRQRVPRERPLVSSCRYSSFVAGKFNLLMNRLNEVPLGAMRRVLL